MRCTVMPSSFLDTRGLDPDAIKKKWRSALLGLERCLRKHFPQIKESSVRTYSIVMEIPEHLQDEVSNNTQCACLLICNWIMDPDPPLDKEIMPQSETQPDEAEGGEERHGGG